MTPAAEVRRAVWKAPGLSPLVRLCLLFVLEHTDPEGAIPPASVMARYFGVARLSVTRALAATIRQGWLEIRRRKGRRNLLTATHVPRSAAAPES